MRTVPSRGEVHPLLGSVAPSPFPAAVSCRWEGDDLHRCVRQMSGGWTCAGGGIALCGLIQYAGHK
ncbi:unnamed protein product [Chondrus crispus]|uniref:Uncharacterized protein n=1 Tax=Chondrus crispus TaxID=2769 RepID=R7Q4B8_CHOCR|nr:unnamed protein product [Chondrus crispus]CDF32196.1 unnamed protein product [Chondrus crispus]|eukprot:XP_005711861.1 unnamed protein product [Chondrus crispus]